MKRKLPDPEPSTMGTATVSRRIARLPCETCPGRTLNICKPLDEGRLGRLLLMGGVRWWRRREALFRTGEPMKSFYKIRKGVVAVSRTLSDGRRQIVALRAPGDCVGYLDNNGTYAFEGEALTDVEACAFDRRQFDSLAFQNPDLAAAVSDTLSKALQQTAQSMMVLGKLRSTERVAHFLGEISALYRERRVCTEPFSLNMGRGEIADYLGLSLETVSRAITKLRKRNVIALIGIEEVEILDPVQLRRIGKFDEARNAPKP